MMVRAMYSEDTVPGPIKAGFSFESFPQLMADAIEAGLKAVKELTIEPMVVDLGDGLTQVIEDGPCGYAWLNIKPARQPFAKWLVDRGYAARREVAPGVRMYVPYFRQSLDKKDAYAAAVADVFRAYGIDASSFSQID